jgi:hypothetical protein
MTKLTAPAVLLLSALLTSCNGGSTGADNTTTTTTAPPLPAFEIETLITVYENNHGLAEWTEATTRDERIGRILLGVDSLTEGTTALDNEGGRVDLQAAIDRLNAQFTEADYASAFGETKENLLRFLNDADGDGWSIDGRNGPGRDWPFDDDGNDPDGWTGQIVVKVTRL